MEVPMLDEEEFQRVIRLRRVGNAEIREQHEPVLREFERATGLSPANYEGLRGMDYARNLPSPPLLVRSTLPRLWKAATDPTSKAVWCVHGSSERIVAVRLLRGRLLLVEHSKDRFAILEAPHRFTGWAFILVGIGLAVTALDLPNPQLAGTALIVLMSVSVLSLGLLALVRSTISIDRKSGILRVRRRLLGIEWEKQYSAANIERVFERKTRGGNGLRLELVGGRKKNLTLFTEYLSLSEQAGTLHYFIQGSRKYLVRQEINSQEQ
jgi:hypothetical protein